MRLSIIYSNGVRQEKHVIDQCLYDDFIVPQKRRLHLLECFPKDKKTVDIKAEIEQIKNTLKPYKVPFCTTGSPIYKAKDTGLLVLGENQGGTHKVEITQLESSSIISQHTDVEDED